MQHISIYFSNTHVGRSSQLHQLIMKGEERERERQVVFNGPVKTLNVRPSPIKLILFLAGAAAFLCPVAKSIGPNSSDILSIPFDLR